ncbi:non-ribosomal peptide synthetase, partial [Francisella philomiragia]
LPELSIQYKDFAYWQREYLEGDILEKQLDYWKGRLLGYETLNLLTDYTRPNKIDYRGNTVGFELEEDFSNKLRKLAKDEGCSLYSLMLSAFYILLYKYTGQEDIVLGTPVANRHYNQLEGLIGFFVNSIALREKVSPEMDVIELMHQVHGSVVQAQEHQDLPFEKLVTSLNIEHDQSRHPIFQVMFNMVESLSYVTDGNYFKQNDLCKYHNISKYDMTLYVYANFDTIQLKFNYKSSLYNKITIKNMLNNYQQILEQVIDGKDLSIKNYNLLNKQDYQRIVYDWNKTDNDYPRDKTVYELFEEQVLKNPDAIAIVFEDQEVTYKELNERSNQLARYIRKQYRRATNQELKPDTLIPLCLERGIDMVIGILGVMKSGGAYVPMDPDYPADRLKHILSDTNAKLVITQNHIEYRFKEVTDILLISINEQNSQTVYQGEKATNLSQYSQATDLAYVIYTSGTTGLPKGALISNYQVIIKLQSIVETFNIKPENVLGSRINYIFDPFLRELFISLITGAKLVLFSKKELIDFYEISNKVYKYKINYLIFVASQLDLFVDYLLTNSSMLDKVKSLSFIFSCGEKLLPKTVNLFYKLFQKSLLINQYGPSECCLYSTYFITRKNNSIIPVGKAERGVKLYVLDEYRYPVPLGVVGELYIGGAGLARGYLNRDDLTTERFVSNPFATELDIANGYTRLYKTGDLVRWLPDGNLEYIGRNDFQVKIRGYRIELGEIENQLLKIEGINQVAVLAKENEETKSKYLVGYYVPQELGKFKQESLLEELSNVLPEYMLPSILVELESFPLTINGKLDRKALPDPEFTNDNNYRAPISDLEVKMCRIWEEVLGLDRVGVTDNFFRIGGNSILAIKLIYNTNNLLSNDNKLTITDLFKYKTIHSLISRIKSFEKEESKLFKKIIYRKDNKYDMYLIHPAGAGCEVYIDLCQKIAFIANSYGLDNYHIISTKKINSLNKLSKLYLKEILLTKNKKDFINIAAWSFGGLIALEMALILEQYGYEKINVCLFDTRINDDKLLRIRNENYDDIMCSILTYYKSLKYSDSHIKTLLKVSEIENELSKQQISGKLIHSNVTLFKALNEDSRFDYKGKDKFYNYMKSLDDNNVGLYAQKLKVISVDAHHGNILENIDLLELIQLLEK